MLTCRRVALIPVPPALARAVVAGDGPALHAALGEQGLAASAGWPHDDTAGGMHQGAYGADAGWLVVHDGDVVGECGWHGGPDAAGDCELSYGIAAPRRRRGLGAEAVATLAGWAAGRPGVRRLTAEVLAGNEPSRRLLARLGFREDPEAADPPYVRYVAAAGRAGAR